ncbi:MAG: adenylate/guanylate cyclase domain-containing protein [Planctomycetota bacterium]
MQNFVPAFIEDKRVEGLFSGQFNGWVAFLDVSGFTPLTETAFALGDTGAELMSRELKRIFDPMVNAIHKHGGFIGGFAGDAFMAFFPDEESAGQRTKAAAQEIIKFFAEHGTSKTRHGDFNFAVKIGIDKGKINWGLPQDKKHELNTWYFKGEAVTGAANAERKASPGDIIWGAHCEEPSGDAPETDTIKAESGVETLGHFFPAQMLQAGERAELRHVVSVFMTISGAENHEEINNVYNVINTACENHGGTLNKIDFGDIGFTALVFFGAPTATEKAELHAVSFSNDLIGTLRSDDVNVKVGIDSGLVYSGILGGDARNEWTCIGDAVNTSCRLMTGAEDGQTLVTSRIQKNADRGWEFDDLGTRALKGKKEEEAIFATRKTKARHHGLAYRNPMIGRENDLAALQTFLEPALAEDASFSGVMRLLGEPGLGKTRLLAALRAKLQKDEVPHTWITMPCDGVHRSGWNAVSTWLRSYFGFTEAASQSDKRQTVERQYKSLTADAMIPEATRDELNRTISFAADLVDCHWEGSPFEKLDDPKLRHENRIIAIKELVRALAYQAPVIFEVEDTHWIDASSAAWLTAMTRNVAKLPFAIVCTSRLSDDGNKPELQVASDIEIQDKMLEPLSGGGFIQAMAGVLLGEGTELDIETVKLVEGKAKGNPFFTEQLLLHLHETGELEKAQGTDLKTKLRLKSTDTARLPGSLSSLVTARIDRLSPDVRETVKHASILGVRFLSSVLGELMKRSGKVNRPIEELLAECEREGVLVPAERTED